MGRKVRLVQVALVELVQALLARPVDLDLGLGQDQDQAPQVVEDLAAVAQADHQAQALLPEATAGIQASQVVDQERKLIQVRCLRPSSKALAA
jgi:DNA-directed RNA polymerase sigma subunit (sigma70/sigma32)